MVAPDTYQGDLDEEDYENHGYGPFCDWHDGFDLMQ